MEIVVLKLLWNGEMPISSGNPRKTYILKKELSL